MHDNFKLPVAETARRTLPLPGPALSETPLGCVACSDLRHPDRPAMSCLHDIDRKRGDQCDTHALRGDDFS